MNVLSSLTKIVPPPSFMVMPSVGVDISDTSMKYVSFHPSLRSDRLRVLKEWGDIKIPKDVLERGEILDPKGMVNALKEFKATTKADYIRVSLPEERAYIFETEIKRNVPPKEIRNVLEFRLEENVPIPARDAIFDYEIIPSYTNQNMVKVVVAAYQRETILKYYDVCREAGLTPLSFEVEAQAMARAVVSNDNDDVVMLLDFGKTRTGVGIVGGQSLLYTSTIDLGGKQLSQMLRKTLGDVPEDELTKIKNTIGLITETDDTKVYDALISTISVIKDEIALRMQYWHQRGSNRDERRIKKVIICGGSGNLRGLPEYLTEMLGAKCVRGNVWQNAFDTSVMIPPIEKRYSYGYATAIGLAIKSSV
ncbi:MAG: pilus assembly protein PilM [Candidatus Nomurabacteria bacterium]|nr:pilus assembly protein PilM [Candidatus Nomurabacteria bacterium]USN88279.1 MAG: pilus assembly protein PilM [Candidatus Nomurabacteria bacterium]